MNVINLISDVKTRKHKQEQETHNLFAIAGSFYCFLSRKQIVVVVRMQFKLITSAFL